MRVQAIVVAVVLGVVLSVASASAAEPEGAPSGHAPGTNASSSSYASNSTSAQASNGSQASGGTDVVNASGPGGLDEAVDSQAVGPPAGIASGNVGENAPGTGVEADPETGAAQGLSVDGEAPGSSSIGLEGSHGASQGVDPASSGIPSAAAQALSSAPAWLLPAGLALAAVGGVATLWPRHGRDENRAGGEGRASRAAPEGVCFRPVRVRAGPRCEVARTASSAVAGASGRSPIEHPGAPGALLLGREALQMDEPGLAVAWFETATRLDPGLAVAHLCLGVALRAAGHAREASGALTRAAQLDPTDARARLHLARALVEDERPSEAIRAVSSLAGTHPDVDQALVEDPALAPLRDDPRFLALVRRL